MAQVTIEIPNKVFRLLSSEGRDPAKEILIGLAIVLYAQGRISLDKAVEVSGLAHADFLERLNRCGLGIRYTEEDLKRDRKTLEELKQAEK